MTQPIASLSLDLDNKWSYLRAHGVDGWNEYPSYLPNATRRIVDCLTRHDIPATIFVVGQDLANADGREAVQCFADAGFEIGNHSQNHYPWLASLSADEMTHEVAETERAIELLTGKKPSGFRAPGFSWSPDLHALLAHRGYRYDASMFPTIIGPVARMYSRLRLPSRSTSTTAPPQTFATMADALRPLNPFQLETTSGQLIEVPVTTMPLTRVPIHVTYFTFLAQFSPHVAKLYLATALRLCQLRRVAPSLLLHPLDFFGCEDEPELTFFPGMKLSRDRKSELLDWLLSKLKQHWRVGTITQQIDAQYGRDIHAASPADPSTMAC